MKKLTQIYQRENVKVLIALADPVELSSLEFLIVSKGFNYRKENDCFAALKTARVFKPDLIIIDVIEPSFDGLLLARKLKAYKKYNGIRFIFLTEKVLLIDKKNPLYSPLDFNIMRPLKIEQVSRKLDSIFNF